MATTKSVNLWWFSLFLWIFRVPLQGFRCGSPQHGSCNSPKWPSSQALSYSKEKSLKKRFRYQGNPKKCQFRVIWSYFGNFQGPISWDEAGTHDISHVIVIHQNDHLGTAGKTNGSGGLVTRPAIYVCNLELIADMFNTRWCHKNMFLVNIITSFWDWGKTRLYICSAEC